MILINVYAETKLWSIKANLYVLNKLKYKKVGVLPNANMDSIVSCFKHWPLVSSERKPFLSDKGPMLEMLDFTIHIGSTPTFLYFNLYLYSAYAAHYVYMY